jgi:hypothetical protein
MSAALTRDYPAGAATPTLPCDAISLTPLEGVALRVGRIGRVGQEPPTSCARYLIGFWNCAALPQRTETQFPSGSSLSVAGLSTAHHRLTDRPRMRSCVISARPQTAPL